MQFMDRFTNIHLECPRVGVAKGVYHHLIKEDGMRKNAYVFLSVS